MNYRTLGMTGYKISEIGFGAWAIGGSWGKTDDTESLKALHAAADAGVNFFDTADVYGNGHSEKLIAQFIQERDEDIIVATKAGRRLSPHNAEGYTGKNIEAFIDRSLINLNTDTLDLVQLHCPPTQVYYNPELFAHMDTLVEKGKIRYYGVSVEKVEEALKAIEYPNVSTVQIIFNLFRQRPRERFFPLAQEKNIGIIVRVPLASGLLTGKFNASTKFEESDHRNFNRHGEAFDQGETFAGIDYKTGLEAVNKLEEIKPKNMSMAQFALRYILDHEAVSTTIPGAKSDNHVDDNTSASELEKLSPTVLSQITKIYDQYARPQVHHRW